MTYRMPGHQAWFSVFGGLSELPVEEIRRVLGLPLMTAARMKTEAQEYIMERDRRLAEEALLREEVNNGLREN